jgi:hypothetical protein
MSAIVAYVITGYRCDFPACAAEITGLPLDSISGAPHFRSLAAWHGWSFWQDAWLWSFCPEHRPASTAYPREVTPVVTSEPRRARVSTP